MLLDTLAQSGTSVFSKDANSKDKTLCGAGSELGDKRAWKGRAKRKTVAQAVNMSLIEAVEKKGEPERKQSYRNAYYCQTRVFSHEGRIYGKYCKNRSCPICCSIRKAQIINRYLPIVKTWKDPFFVTLTVKAVPAGSLKLWIFGFKKAFRQIREKLKKQHQRGGGVKLVGIKSLECNFNATQKTYNPHLHLIVSSEAVADAIIQEWLLKWTPKHTSPLAQHKRRVRSPEKDLIETIKYGSKVFTDPDVKQKGKFPRKVYAAALDNILEAMKSYRLFERFGFNLPKVEKVAEAKTISEDQCKAWEFDRSANDWINPETGEKLTGFAPPPQLLWLLSQNMDIDAQ
jgi:hypothetical protein